MDRKHYLLPHSFQRIGWALLIACPILFGIILLLFNGLRLIPQSYSQFGTLALYLTAAFAALFVGLSEEKQEDEFIQSIRLRSIAQTAYICFVLMILSAILVDTLVAFRVQNRSAFFSFYQLFNSIIFAFFVYIVIFRYRLFKYRKEASHEE
jgi:hypothetical protein